MTFVFIQGNPNQKEQKSRFTTFSLITFSLHHTTGIFTVNIVPLPGSLATSMTPW